jgi:hypothetical protein
MAFLTTREAKADILKARANRKNRVIISGIILASGRINMSAGGAIETRRRLMSSRLHI